MYGEPYGKSLCHAWSCGPAYLLGRYCLGVTADEPGYRRFTVAPEDGMYNSYSGIVPTPRGDIRVSVMGRLVQVVADMDGGTLKWGTISYEIPKGEPITVEM